MMEPKESKSDIFSIKLTKDQNAGQSDQIRWNGNYGKYLAQHFRTLVMGHSRLTTSNQILLTKVEELLSKCTGAIGTEMKPFKKQ